MMIGHKKTGSGSSAHKNLERHLLSVTFVSLMVYRVFCIIAAVSQNKVKYPDQNEGVLLVGERHYALVSESRCSFRVPIL